MPAIIKPGWIKPSTILFASEFPPNEKAFALALTEAGESGANLIVLHAHDSSDVIASNGSTTCENDAKARKHRLEPLAARASDIGVNCKIVVRYGMATDQILAFLRERKIDRVVMGSRSPGPIGKLLVGSVAEAVLRTANVPVCIVGPNVVEGTYRNPVTRKILCDVSRRGPGTVVANFGAQLAAEQNADLILYRVIPPQERAQGLADLTLHQIEEELPTLVPARLRGKVSLQTRVALGDPTEELLYQGRAQKASRIVLGAPDASPFAAITRAGTVYKVLAYAHCPVITMSPTLLAACGAEAEKPCPLDVNYIAGVI